METFEIILRFIIELGIPAIIGGYIYVGKKLQILDGVDKDIDELSGI